MGPEVFSRFFFRRDSKVLLDPIILFNEGFEWRFEVEWKDGRDEVLSWKTLEVVPNLDQAKWEESDEVEETLLINEEEISKSFWVVSSES